MKKFLKVLLVLFLIAAIAVVGGYMYLIDGAPSLSSIDARPDGFLTVINDKDGNQIDSLHDTESNRIYVKLEQIPVELQKAFIAIEDARFYDHPGIDVIGIARAGVKGVMSGFKFSQGASTLTQQLLKNNVFTDWMGENSFSDRLSRKAQEIHLALQLERKYDKNWILENYLNTINLGGGTRGVMVAAQYYFGKDVSELSLAQCALIAGITKNPSGYNPFKNPEKSLDRQHLVLNAMEKEGYITPKQHKKALEEDVIAELDNNHKILSSKVFSYFEDALLNQVVEDLCQKRGYDEGEAWNLIYTGGLTINSTEDANLQKIAEEKVCDNSLFDAEEEVSVVITDVANGSVAAIIGGRGEKTASLVYNRATDSVRQPGSCIKVLGEYAAGLDVNDLTLGTVYDDAPYSYSNGTKLKNAYSSYKGLIPLRQAIAVSTNTIAVKAYQDEGYTLVKGYLDDFGLASLGEEGDNEALSIGGTTHGVTNLEMTAAYNAIANRGKYIKPYFYTTVLDHDGSVLLEHQVEERQVIEEETSDVLGEALREVMASGTGTPADFPGMDLAGKSGTTNGNRDLWFMGYSGYYTCGVWGGYDNNSEQKGSQYVKKIWKAIMQEGHKGLKSKSINDRSKLETATICTKCGNLAITGTCDKSEQGNMTAKEYFKPGTKPTKQCDCHIKVTVCQETGKAVNYCPLDYWVEKIYLAHGSADTADEKYAANLMQEDKCKEHDDIWNLLHIGLDGENDPEEGEGENGGQEGQGAGQGSGQEGGHGSGQGTGDGQGQGFDGNPGHGYGGGHGQGTGGGQGQGTDGNHGQGAGNGQGQNSDGDTPVNDGQQERSDSSAQEGLNSMLDGFFGGLRKFDEIVDTYLPFTY